MKKRFIRVSERPLLVLLTLAVSYLPLSCTKARTEPVAAIDLPESAVADPFAPSKAFVELRHGSLVGDPTAASEAMPERDAELLGCKRWQLGMKVDRNTKLIDVLLGIEDRYCSVDFMVSHVDPNGDTAGKEESGALTLRMQYGRLTTEDSLAIVIDDKTIRAGVAPGPLRQIRGKSGSIDPAELKRLATDARSTKHALVLHKGGAVQALIDVLNALHSIGREGIWASRATYGSLSAMISAEALAGKPAEIITPPPSLDGELSRTEIKSVIDSERKAIRGCFEQALAQKPEFNGRVNVRFVIGPDGTVTATEVMRTNVDHESMLACLVSTIDSFKFPKPRGGSVSVVYPFVFRSR
ncbi:MAG: AgmX/PglI C-terminal domain-containing protein [Myxococcota bacterium]